MARPDQKSGWFDLSFQTKLVLGMCGVVLLTGVVIFAVADRTNRSSTQVLVNSLFREVSSHAVTQTRDYVLRAAPVARSLEELADSGLAEACQRQPALLGGINVMNGQVTHQAVADAHGLTFSPVVL